MNRGGTKVQFKINPNPDCHKAYLNTFAEKMLMSRKHRETLQKYRKLIDKIGYLLLQVFQARTLKLTIEFDPVLLDKPALLDLLQERLGEMDSVTEILDKPFENFPHTEITDPMMIRFYPLRGREIAVQILVKRGKSPRTVTNNLIIARPKTKEMGKTLKPSEEAALRLYARWKKVQQKSPKK